MHVLVNLPLSGQMDFSSLQEGYLLAAISEGHCFIGFDLFGDTTGFRYSAHDEDENRMMGDEIKLENEVRLVVSFPLPARIVLLKDGEMVEVKNVRQHTGICGSREGKLSRRGLFAATAKARRRAAVDYFQSDLCQVTRHQEVFHLSLADPTGSATDAEPRAVASGCKHSMLNPPERSIHC